MAACVEQNAEKLKNQPALQTAHQNGGLNFKKETDERLYHGNLLVRAPADAKAICRYQPRLYWQLKSIHPVFQFLEWVGNRPDNAAKLASDLSNLDALIYTYAQDKEAIYQKSNADGTASWESFGSGYGMGYSTGTSIPGGDVVIRIRAGQTSSRNAAVV